MQNNHYQSTYPDNTRCLDTYYTGYSSDQHSNFDMPRQTHGNHPNWQPIHILKLPTACSATSSHFYLPPRYETPILDVNVSLTMANLQMINISAQHFYIWQHLGNNKSDMQLQHLTTYPQFQFTKFTNISSIAPCQLYLLMLNLQKIQFPSGAVFTHPGIYISALGSIIPVGIGLFCCYFFWCQPARLAC